MSINRNILVLAAIVLLMFAFLGGFCRYEATTSNIWNASCVGDIPVPNGFDRVEAPTGSYTEYLRSIPLKEKGYKLHLHSGQVAKHQVLAAAVVDQPLLNQNEQCADVAMRLRAEYLWKNGRYDEIRFTTVHDTVMRYRPDTTHAYSMRFYFEEYLAEVFKWCNTGSLYNPQSVIRPTFGSISLFFRSVHDISAFLPASCPYPCLAVARYDFASDVANLRGTNTNLS